MDRSSSRKRRWGDANQSSSSSSTPATKKTTATATATATAAQASIQEALKKAKAAAAIQKQIQERLQKMRNNTSTPSHTLGQHPPPPPPPPQQQQQQPSGIDMSAIQAQIQARVQAMNAKFRHSKPASSPGNLPGNLHALKSAGSVASSSSAFLPPPSSGIDMSSTLLQLKQRVAMAQQMVKQKQQQQQGRTQWRALRVDSQGREIDEKGNVIEIAKKAPVEEPTSSSVSAIPSTSAFASSAAASAGPTAATSSPSPSPSPSLSTASYFDESLVLRVKERKKKGFKFAKAGVASRKAAVMRQKQMSKLIKLQSYKSISEGEKVKRREREEMHRLKQTLHEIPDVEWWDKPLLKPISISTSASAPSASPSAKMEGGEGDVGDMDAVAVKMETGAEKAGDANAGANADADPNANTNAGVVTEEKAGYAMMELDVSVIHGYLYNPVKLVPNAELPKPPPQALLLTKKERKKMKRMKNLEKQRELQDMIRFGLMAPPEPRLTLTNIMAVLGDDAVLNPSSAEAMVKKQMRDRQTKHSQHNKDRKEEARQKKQDQYEQKLQEYLANNSNKQKSSTSDESQAASPSSSGPSSSALPLSGLGLGLSSRKYDEDTTIQVHVALFRCGDLSSQQRRYKVDINAQQLHLTGASVVFDDCHMVMVEGGPKGIKKFARLLLHRIKWVDDEEREYEEEGGEAGGEGRRKRNQATTDWTEAKCVWRGTTAKRLFPSFSISTQASEQAARQVFGRKGVGHYWDLCKQAPNPARPQY